jgi:hypothetical protein
VDEKMTASLELESAIRGCSVGSKLSLQRGANFREGMGNGLRLWITRDDGHKPQKRKETIMKNANMQFKPTAVVLIPLLLACLAAGLILAIIPARATEMVPFHATLVGYVETSEFLPPCTIHGHSIVSGNATHLGAYTGTGELYQDICDSTFIGSFHQFAANGDEIYGTFEGYLTPTGTPGVYDNHQTGDVTGGTGRFTGATGHWEAGGQVDFTTEPISFVTPSQGWISTVGSNRR